MKAVQVVGYHSDLELTEIPDPAVEGPFDVVVRIGGAGVCRTDIHILEGQWEEKAVSRCPTPLAMRTPAGCTRSATR